MGTVENSAAHYEAVIADLIADQAMLRADADRAAEIAKSKQQAASDIELVIERLKSKLLSKSPAASQNIHNNSGDSRPHVGVQSGRPVADFLAGLQLGDACVAVLRALGRPATNREILGALEDNGFQVKSDNPMNNVGTCLNHRSNSKRDIIRDGKFWRLNDKKDDSIQTPGMNGQHYGN